MQIPLKIKTVLRLCSAVRQLQLHHCTCIVIAFSHRRCGQDKTRLVLSCSCRRCEHNCRQDKTVLRLNSCKLETGSRQDKTVLPCRQLCSHRRRGQDKARQFCLVRVGGVHKPLLAMLQLTFTVRNNQLIIQQKLVPTTQ